MFRTVVCLAAFQWMSVAVTEAQLPPGTTQVVTVLPEVVKLVTDPVTGTVTKQTTKETLLDLKHEDMVQFSMCTGELIVINGHARFTFRATTSADGHVMQQQHQESAGAGYGEVTGWRYTYNQTSQSKFTTTTTRADSMIVAHEHLIRQGEVATVGGDDQFLQTNLHISLINGQPVPRVDKFEFECR